MSSDINFLIEMGFSQEKAEKALSETGNSGIENAMEWLMSHQDDPEAGVTSQNTDNSSDNAASEQTSHGEPAENAVAKSLKCDDCGKLLRNIEEAEFHASKTNHSNFSESTEEKKPLSEAEKREQVAKLQEKLRLKKMEREEKEKQEEREREKQRRLMGKDISVAKAKHDELEMKKIAEERRREKEEEKLAKQRVREQLEKDKIERAKKFSKTTEPSVKSTGPSTVASSQVVPTDVAKKAYDTCKLQIRYTNGQAVTQEFSAKEPLAAVRLFVQLNGPNGQEPFQLMTTFPRKVFGDSDMQTPLSDLGLVPAAVLVVTKSS